MKKMILLAFSIVTLSFLIAQHSCAVKPPSNTSLGVSPTATPFTGSVVVNDASTGTCSIHVWLDATGPVIIPAGNTYTFTNVNPGSHNLTFNTTNTVSCGSTPTSTPVACTFTNNGNTTGYSCSFNLNSNQVETAGITDNGCNQLTVTNPN